jgi:hypothetical protein
MILNPATVSVIEMVARNSDNFDFKFAAAYDGNVKYLFKNINMYIFAFHNASHNKTGSFVIKYPEPGNEALIEAKKNVV